MNPDQAINHSQEVVPEGHFLLCSRRRWCSRHVVVKVSEICIFQNDVVRLLTNKAAIEANDVQRGDSIVLEPFECFSLGVIVRLRFCGLIGLQYVGVLVLVIRVLLSVRNVHCIGKNIHPTACSGGTSLS